MVFKKHSNTGSANGMSLGQDYLFVQPIADKGSVQETCLKTIIFANGTEITHFSFKPDVAGHANMLFSCKRAAICY